MRGRTLATVVAATLLSACQLPPAGVPPRSGEDRGDQPFQDEISLPPLDGLGLTKVGPPGAEEPGARNWLTVVRVNVPADGTPTLAGWGGASWWRGVALPHDETGLHVLREAPPLVTVRVVEDGKIRVGRSIFEDFADLKRALGATVSRSPGTKVVLDFDRKAAFGRVLPVLAAVLEIVDRPSLRGPDPEAERYPVENLLPAFKAVAERSAKDVDGLPMVCVRIRAEESAPYGAVQDVIVVAMRAYIWRLSFCGLLDGREVEIGSVWRSPEEPELDVFAWHPGSEEIEEDAEEDVEIQEHTGRIPGRGRGDTTVDVPLGGTGIVRELGAGAGRVSPFGLRTGAWRRRAAIRGGGSRKSERAVDAALRWLVRHQEADGRWYAAKLGGKKGNDAGVTGLAVLALLGAGHTEKIGEHRLAVAKAVDWIVTRQDESGCIGVGSPKLGYHHAICGLALAEAYGIAEMRLTGEAAQKAVEYSVNVHQVKYGGWRYEPGQKADTSVTGWFVCQLKFAHVVGLEVPVQAFGGASAHLDTVTVLPGRGQEQVGPAKYMPGPGEKYTPPMTAIAMLCRQWMGWAREDPDLVGGANYLYRFLPEWPEADPGMESTKLDFYYWHFGSLAMFQMGGDWWKQWNACLRDMLVEKQHNTPHDLALDGSWDPIGYSASQGGRVFSTAMGAMCLETYYRYKAIYRK